MATEDDRLRRLAAMRNRRQRRSAAPNIKEITAKRVLEYLDRHDRLVKKRARLGKDPFGRSLDDVVAQHEKHGKSEDVAVEDIFKYLRSTKAADSQQLSDWAESAARMAQSGNFAVKTTDANLAIRVTSALAKGRGVSRIPHPRTGVPFDLRQPDPMVDFFFECWAPTVLARRKTEWLLTRSGSETGNTGNTGNTWEETTKQEIRALIVSNAVGPGTLAKTLRYLENRGLVDVVEDAGEWSYNRKLSSLRFSKKTGKPYWMSKWQKRVVEGPDVVRIRRALAVDTDGKSRWVPAERLKALALRPGVQDPEMTVLDMSKLKVSLSSDDGGWKPPTVGEHSAKKQAIEADFVWPSTDVIDQELEDLVGKEEADRLKRLGEHDPRAGKGRGPMPRVNSTARKIRTLRAIEGHCRARENLWQMQKAASGDGRPDGVWVDVKDICEILGLLSREELELRLVEGAVSGTLLGEERWFPVITGGIQVNRVINRGLAEGKLDAVRRWPVEGDGIDIPKTLLSWTHVRLKVPSDKVDESMNPPRLWWTGNFKGLKPIWETEAEVVVQYGTEPEVHSRWLIGEAKEQAVARETAEAQERALYRRKKMVPASQRDLVT